MAPGDTARLYHRLTSYEPGRDWTIPIDDPLVRQDFVPNDFATWPAPCKAYPHGLPVVELPRSWPAVAAPATAVLAGTQVAAPALLDRPALARLLHLSAGVVRVLERKDRPTLLLRAAGSAGGRFPLELYVSALGVEGLADGVHWYDPVGHALLQVAPPAAGEATTLVAKARRCGAPGCRTSSPSTPSKGWSRGSTAGPTSTGRCAAVSCATSCAGPATTRVWDATPRSS